MGFLGALLIDGCGLAPLTNGLRLNQTLPHPLPASLTQEQLPEGTESGLKPNPSGQADSTKICGPDDDIRVALLTGADDRSYALGLASSLLTQGISIDFIGSDTVNCRELDDNPLINFLNLRGDQSENVSIPKKVLRIGVYYARILKYAIVAKPRIFHILWNNKFELFDRTLLMFYYRLMGRKITLTIHNLNTAKRDSRDSIINRVSLKIQYRLANHMFVHSENMKNELSAEFSVPEIKITTIPFAINDTFPTTNMTSHEAKIRMGLDPGEEVILFFGQIAPYKGLQYLIECIPTLIESKINFRVLIAGKPKAGNEEYWRALNHHINNTNIKDFLIIRSEHIPDEEVEIFFKASDVLVLPYTDIYQSGLPFLAYSFGLPVIATDVGSLREGIVEGRTGYVCRPRDPADLARTIRTYFSSHMYRNLAMARMEIQQIGYDRFSWTNVAITTASVYRQLLERRSRSLSPSSKSQDHVSRTDA